jgi:hypothetical protein
VAHVSDRSWGGLRLLARADRRLCDDLVDLYRAGIGALQRAEASGICPWRCHAGRILSAVGPTHLNASGALLPNLAAYLAAFLAAAVLALVAAGIALAVSDRDAAATMPPRQSGDQETLEQTMSAEALP